LGWFFSLMKRPNIKLWDEHSAKGERSEIIHRVIYCSIKKYNITEKSLTFYGDNTNIDSGGAIYRGKMELQNWMIEWKGT
jgi:hypothetical protein